MDYPAMNSDITLHEGPYDISIYTDGSKNKGNVGAAFVLSNHHSGETHRSAFRLGPHCSVPQAEIFAITKAIDYIYTEWFPHKMTIAIFSDSITAIRSITSSRNRGNNVLHIHSLLSLNTHNHNVHFKWVRGHSGVAGNEAADSLAKTAAASSLPLSYEKIPPSKIKQWNYELALQHWQHQWDNGNTGRLTHKFIPNIANRLQWKHFSPSFAMTQLITGHGNFNAYLKRFRIQDEDICNCDGTSIQDSIHYLFDCAFYNHNRDIVMGSVLYSGFNWPCPLNAFLDHKDIYHKLMNYLSTTAALTPTSSQQ
ncbi:uncharacterized protein LOC111624280 [Centruroides sculpturatus]|uniref:uncharacterized protein LOC111624280 n=1 Tax=Centruroides sculpturatus TaxID=218467 RepID=UPI000C6DF1D1|nr:uncharacterized protein LOC111624280 [Centruroides sculpturatus]